MCYRLIHKFRKFLGKTAIEGIDENLSISRVIRKNGFVARISVNNQFEQRFIKQKSIRR